MRRAIRFSLRSLLDPELTPSQRFQVKQHFDNRCAFCGADLRGIRGHMDHLVSVAAGGSNHISNRVPACSRCNGEEKLDRDWREFLACAVGDPEVLQHREEQIVAWTTAQGPAVSRTGPAQRAALEEETTRVLAAFDSAVDRLRAAKRGVG